MNGCEERIAVVESKVDTQQDEINKVRMATHDHASMLVVMQATLQRMESVNTSATARFEKHMESEEAAFSKLYLRLKNMDEQLVASFKERDDKLHTLDKAQVKLLAYATAAFAVVTVLADVVVGKLS